MPYLLQALWQPAGETSEASLFLWAESDGPLGVRPEGRSAVRDHPRQIPPKELRTQLARFGGGLLYECAEPADLVLHLPTWRGRPLSSAGGAAGRGAKPAFAPWRLRGLRVPPADALPFLCGLPREAPPPLQFGETVRFWSECASLCLGLLARQRFVPVLSAVTEAGMRRWQACWRPVLSDPEDRHAVELLAGAMPWACRVAGSGGVGAAPTAENALLLTRDFIATLCDAGVRPFLAEEGFPDRTTRRGEPGRIPGGPLGAWLRALGWLEGEVEGEARALEGFARELRRWNEALEEPAPGSFRTALRLTPPAADPGAAAAAGAVAGGASSATADGGASVTADEAASATAAVLAGEASSGTANEAVSLSDDSAASLSDDSAASLSADGAASVTAGCAPLVTADGAASAPAAAVAGGAASVAADGVAAGGATDAAADAAPTVPPDAPWLLEFLLQDRQDPEVLVPAARVWEETGRQLRLGGRTFDQPQDRLLEDLGRASRIFPPLDRALQRPGPTGCTLSVEEAHAFLRLAAPLLEESGFGVLLPSWWKEDATRPRLRLRLRPGQQGVAAPGGVLGSRALIAYDWEIALGDSVLAPEAFQALVREQRPLVRLHGRWVELDPARTDGIHALLRDLPEGGNLTLSEAVRWSAGGPDPLWNGDAPEVVAEGWILDLLHRLRGEEAVLPVAMDERFRGTLRPYQQRGVAWLDFLRRCGLGACLADDMGLGKTVQLIALLLHERPAGGAAGNGSETGAAAAAARGTGATTAADGSETGTATAAANRTDATAAADGSVAEAAAASADGTDTAAAAAPDGSPPPCGPTLVLCPMSVVGNWQREIERFAPELRVLVHHGLRRRRDLAFASEASHYDVVITTYALAHRDRTLLRGCAWERLVLDEAQNLKNPGTLQARAVRSLRAQTRVALTGTPLENRLSELWSILETLNPGYLGSRGDFRQSFAVPIERNRDPRRRETLRRLVQPFLLRRLKTDPEVIRDLPEKLEMDVYCNLTREQAGLYQAVVDEMLTAIDRAEGIARRGLVLAALTRLKQICNHPAQYLRDGTVLEGRSGKVARLAEMLEEVRAVGERALVFTQFAEMGKLLESYLAARLRCEVLFLHGGTPKGERDRMVDRFAEADGPPIFLLSLRAGGTGLNLTPANHVFHFDRWWNPAVEDQATDRAFRIGQTRNVQVHKFICVGTLEERIDRMIREKRDLADLVVGSGEQWLTELDTRQLREVLLLSRDAVSEEEE